MLDANGLIISVNETWRKFADANALHGPGHAVGVNYVEFCEQARGAESSEAHQIAQGIRSVLTHETKSFSIEYPCHSAMERLWFLMTVTPLADYRASGAVVMYLDITERKLAEAKLRESERRLSSMMSNVELLFLMLDEQGRITYCNEYLLALVGWRHEEEVLGKSWLEWFLPAEIRRQMGELFVDLLANIQSTFHHENEIVTRAGLRRNIRWSNTLLRSADDAVIGTASIGEDITQRTEQAHKITRLNRIRSVIGGISSAMLRLHDRDDLLQEACRVAATEGVFPVAWISVLDLQTRSSMSSRGIALTHSPPT